MTEPITYQGQFGEFTITDSDRQGVIIYRAGLMVAALCFAAGVALVVGQGGDRTVLPLLSLLYTVFLLALGVSLLTIHIYMGVLHRALQVCWLVGVGAAIAVSHGDPDPFVLTVYQHPLTLLGIGFAFVALTGIFFKEAVCFNRLETKFLTPLVPVLLLGHLTGILPLTVERGLLVAWAGLMLIFAVRKAIQPLPPDIGDKSVFEYLKQARSPANVG